jgi:hypothetical protein
MSLTGFGYAGKQCQGGQNGKMCMHAIHGEPAKWCIGHHKRYRRLDMGSHENPPPCLRVAGGCSVPLF